MRFKTYLESIETPPHLPYNFYKKHLELFKSITNSIGKFPFAKFNKLAKDFLYNSYYHYLEDFEYLCHIVNRHLTNAISNLEFIIDSNNKEPQDEAKALSRTIKEDFPAFDFYKASQILDTLKNDIAIDWDKDPQELKEYFNLINQFEILLNIVNNFLEKNKIYNSKTKALVASINRKTIAYYDGKSPDRHSKPETNKVETLYHATTAVNEILKNGFKTRKELEKVGIGGGPDDLISFTADIQIAESIVWALRRAVDINTGKLTLKGLELLGKRLGNYEDAYKSAVSTFGKYKEGNKEWLFDLFKSILFFQSKVYNPVFSSVKIADFNDAKDIGIIAADINMDGVVEYLASMEEYRVKKEAIIKIWKVPYKGIREI